MDVKLEFVYLLNNVHTTYIDSMVYLNFEISTFFNFQNDLLKFNTSIESEHITTTTMSVYGGQAYEITVIQLYFSCYHLI